MALSEVKSRIRGIPNILDIHIKYRENPDLSISNAKSISTTVS
jgi:hypothetical protein